MPRVVPTEIVQALRQYSEDEIEFVFDLNGVRYGNAGLDVRFRDGDILNVCTRNDRRNMVHMQPDGTQLRQNGALQIIRTIAVNEDPYSVFVFITTAAATFEIYATSQTVRKDFIYQRSTLQDSRVFQSLRAAAEDGSLRTLITRNIPFPNVPQTACALNHDSILIMADDVRCRAQITLHRGELFPKVRIDGVSQPIRGFAAEADDRAGIPAWVVVRTNDYTLQIVATSYIFF